MNDIEQLLKDFIAYMQRNNYIHSDELTNEDIQRIIYNFLLSHGTYIYSMFHKE